MRMEDGRNPKRAYNNHKLCPIIIINYYSDKGRLLTFHTIPDKGEQKEPILDVFSCNSKPIFIVISEKPYEEKEMCIRDRLPNQAVVLSFMMFKPMCLVSYRLCIFQMVINLLYTNNHKSSGPNTRKWLMQTEIQQRTVSNI